jgi:hypothetical protein
MSLTQAQSASIGWQPAKKHWTVTIRIGAEVIRRPLATSVPRDAGDDTLNTMAVHAARDEGYEVPPEAVSIER